jgi:hypothetical protein
MLADVGFERFDAGTMFPGFLLDLEGRFFRFVVIEDDIGSGLREQFYRRGADTPGTACDECRLACQ